MPDTLDELLRQAEHVVDDINNHKQGMVRRAVRKTRLKPALLWEVEFLRKEALNDLCHMFVAE